MAVISGAPTISAKLKFPANADFAFTGTVETQTKSRRESMVKLVLVDLLIIALLLIFLVNCRNSGLVLANLPF